MPRQLVTVQSEEVVVEWAVTKARHLAVAVGIAVAAVAAPAAPNKTTHLVQFPSAQTQAAASDKRFAVVNVDSDKEPHHALFGRPANQLTTEGVGVRKER